MTFCFPSTFVFNKRMMYWKLWQVSIAVRTRIIVKASNRRASREPAPAESTTPMQAPLPFPASMLVLHHCVLCASTSAIGTKVLLLQHAVANRERPCLEAAVSGERRVMASAYDAGIVGKLKATCCWGRT